MLVKIEATKNRQEQMCGVSAKLCSCLEQGTQLQYSGQLCHRILSQNVKHILHRFAALKRNLC